MFKRNALRQVRPRVASPPAVPPQNWATVQERACPHVESCAAMEDIVDFQEWLQRYILPHWVEDQSPDRGASAPATLHRQVPAQTAHRQERLDRQRAGDDCPGLPAIIAGMLLGTTFLSFVILDETR